MASNNDPLNISIDRNFKIIKFSKVLPAGGKTCYFSTYIYFITWEHCTPRHDKNRTMSILSMKFVALIIASWVAASNADVTPSFVRYGH